MTTLCIEFGLYEEALEEIAVVEAAMSNPKYSVPEKVRTFCQAARKRLESGETDEYSEIEAAKRLERLRRFMDMEPRDEEKATNEIKVIRELYADTEIVKEKSALLEEHSQALPSRP